MTQWLKTSTALVEDPSSGPGTIHVTPAPGEGI